MGCQDGLATDHDDVTVHDLTCRADQVLDWAPSRRAPDEFQHPSALRLGQCAGERGRLT